MAFPEAGSVVFVLALSAFICLGTNMLGYLIAVATKTHKITDLIGCGTFAISAWATHVAAARGNDVAVVSGYRPLFITIGVTFWSVRLAGFLFYRILQTKTDKCASPSATVASPVQVLSATGAVFLVRRFDGFYNAPGEPWLTGPSIFPVKLLGFWTLQALWEWAVLLPVTAAQAAEPRQEMGTWGWIGFAVYMLLFAFEAGADFQKDWFKRQPGNRSEFVRTGFFYWCQFPNYFGEIAIWWALFFWAGFPDVFLSHPWIVVSPIFTTVLLRWGSGVATLAHSQWQRYGPREDYRRYVATTPVLMPFMKPFYLKNEPKPFEAPAADGKASQ